MANKPTDKDKGMGKRRQQLEQEMQAIEEKLGHSVNQLRDEVESKVEKTRNYISPAYWIRRYPHYALGTAVFVGFLLAPSGRKKKSSSGRRNGSSEGYENSNYDSNPMYRAPGLGSILVTEIKRMATRKATDYLVNKLEETIDKNLRGNEKEKD